MAIYVYAPVLYPGTRELLEALQAKRIVKHDGMHFLHNGRRLEFAAQDVIVCWGHHVPSIAGVTVLNASYKHRDALGFMSDAQIANSLGDSVVFISPQRMSVVEYNAQLEKLRANGGILKGRPAYVPLEEFPPYGSYRYTLQNPHKITLFSGKVISGSDIPEKLLLGAQRYMQAADLTFAALSMATIDGTAIIRKVLTAPKLDAAGAAQFAKQVKHYLKSKDTVDKITTEMAKLLE